MRYADEGKPFIKTERRARGTRGRPSAPAPRERTCPPLLDGYDRCSSLKTSAIRRGRDRARRVDELGDSVSVGRAASMRLWAEDLHFNAIPICRPGTASTSTLLDRTKGILR